MTLTQLLNYVFPATWGSIFICAAKVRLTFECVCVCVCVSLAKILDIHSGFLPCLGQLDCHVLDSSGHLKVCFRGSVLFFFVCRKEKLEQEAKSSAERFEEVIMVLLFFVVDSWQLSEMLHIQCCTSARLEQKVKTKEQLNKQTNCRL